MSKILKEEEPKVTSLVGKNFDEAVDLLGSNLFDEENIPLLKEAGLLSESGYPIEEYEAWNGDMKTREMSISDLMEYDSNFIDSDYIKRLAVGEILKRSNKNDNGDVIFKYHASDLPERRRDMSKDFMESCFAGDVLEYFLGTWDNLSLNDCQYHFDDIPEEVKETLEYHGLPRNFYELYYKNELDDEDDSLLSEYYDDLESIMIQAVADGYERGSEIACLNDFENAWQEAIPEGCRWDNTTTTEDVRPIIVPQSYIESHIDSILKDWLGYYSNDVLDAFHEFMKDTINENFDFTEPYYGWQEFDEEAFKDDLYERLVELDLPVPEMVELGLDEEEPSLLNFNGETGEYEEDLEEELETVDIEKPKKLFYKYKEYNPELSAKAWRLDIVRLNALIDWLKDHKGFSPDGGTFYNEMLSELEGWVSDGDFSNYIIMSKVKPSYAKEGIANYYCIWIDNGDYDTNYVGAIPQGVGDSILNLTPMVEELDVINVPHVEIGPDNFTAGHSYEELEDIVARKANSSNWILQTYDAEYDEWDNNYLFKTLPEVLLMYDRWDSPDEDDAITLVYVPDRDEDPELEDGSYVICGKFGSGEIHLNEETNKDNHYYFVWWCDERDLEDGDMFRTGLVTTPKSRKPTPEEVLAMYSEIDGFQGNPGYVIVDVDEITKEEFEDYFLESDSYPVFDINKYGTVDLNDLREEIDNTVTYFEVYCEPEDETTWDFEEQEFKGIPCYDNQSFILVVDDELATPSIEEVKKYMEEENILTGNYVPLYLSELDPEYAPDDIFDADAIHYYKPKDSTVIIEEFELVDFPVKLPADKETITLNKQQKEDLVYMFPRYLDYLKSIPEYWDEDKYTWIITGEDNTDGHIIYGTKVFAWILQIMYIGPTEDRPKPDQRIWMALEFKDNKPSTL